MDERPEVMDPREQRLNDVLGAYLEMEDAGCAPDRRVLLSRYPEFKSDLEAFFVAQSRVAALAYPCPAFAQRQGKASGAASDEENETNLRPAGRSDAEDRRSIGDYELAELINEGGMGKVYKAKLKWTDSWVALKKIKTGRLASRSEVRRFLDEVSAAASLHHPNIVPIYHAGEDDGQPFFTMQLFEHGSLQQHLPRFAKDHRAAADLLAKVARAVHYAHRHGILHRDLKPANILLDAQEQPHVTDFGLAKRLRAPIDGAGRRAAPAARKPAPATVQERHTDPGSDADADLDVSYCAPEQTGPTQPLDHGHKTQGHTVTDPRARGQTRVGAFIGTKGYLPPEHAEVSTDGTSTAADVYSLGAMLYKMLTGRTLFDTAATLADAVRQVKECVPEAPHALNPQTDERLEAICMQCLRKDPLERYGSAELLAEDLERWLRGEPPEAWPLPWRLRAWRTIQPHLLVAAAAACAGVAAAAIFFVYYYFNSDRVPDALGQKARKERVTLIGETGPPRWSEWNIGAGTALVGQEANEPFFVTTLEDARLELLRKAPPRYRFSAELRHEQAFDQGWIGIYFAHSQKATKDDIKHYWWDVSFADVGKAAIQFKGPDPTLMYGVVQLTARRYGQSEGKLERPNQVRKLFVAAQAANKAAPWRKLAVEVTPEKIRWFWEGERFSELATADVRKLGDPWKSADETLSYPEVEFRPEGSLGLYVHRGKASFRNVIIEPLE